MTEFKLRDVGFHVLRERVEHLPNGIEHFATAQARDERKALINIHHMRGKQSVSPAQKDTLLVGRIV
jgi:hypothetical protein